MDLPWNLWCSSLTARPTWVLAPSSVRSFGNVSTIAPTASTRRSATGMTSHAHPFSANLPGRPRTRRAGRNTPPSVCTPGPQWMSTSSASRRIRISRRACSLSSPHSAASFGSSGLTAEGGNSRVPTSTPQPHSSSPSRTRTSLPGFNTSLVNFSGSMTWCISFVRQSRTPFWSLTSSALASDMSSWIPSNSVWHSASSACLRGTSRVCWNW